MQQLIQDFKTGEVKVVDVPAPVAQAGCLLVRNAYSLVSAGTERSTVSTGQKSLLGKARARPDLVKKVIDSARREGVLNAIQKVQARLDTWKTLGYSTAGTVVQVGEGVDGFRVGDRVACGGQDKASHADYVNVPVNLCAQLPEGVEFRHACFTTVGVIALHGVRQADLRVGETAAVIGLGLVGQLAVQILKASGCRVLGIDVDPAACELALKSGADVVGVRGKDDIETLAAGLTNGYGVDAVLIAAAASTNDPMELAAKIARDRASVVLVGVSGMEIPRDPYFARELRFSISRSYGPGRYDPLYEEAGIDYPIGYVRWTEGRNFEAFLNLIAERATRPRSADYPHHRHRRRGEGLRGHHRQDERAVRRRSHPLSGRRRSARPSDRTPAASRRRVGEMRARRDRRRRLRPGDAPSASEGARRRGAASRGHRQRGHRAQGRRAKRLRGGGLRPDGSAR